MTASRTLTGQHASDLQMALNFASGADVRTKFLEVFIRSVSAQQIQDFCNVPALLAPTDPWPSISYWTSQVKVALPLALSYIDCIWQEGIFKMTETLSDTFVTAQYRPRIENQNLPSTAGWQSCGNKHRGPAMTLMTHLNTW